MYRIVPVFIISQIEKCIEHAIAYSNVRGRYRNDQNFKSLYPQNWYVSVKVGLHMDTRTIALLLNQNMTKNGQFF